MAREPISKKLRFEVFKRDAFTCQYCGAKAPEVVLHCDHIKPVADDGTSDILNLITACAGCNAGKGARALSDQTVLAKQVDQLAELQERREQLELMIQWRDSLRSLEEDHFQAIIQHIQSRYTFELNERGLADIRRWLKRYSVLELMTAADHSFDSYIQIGANDSATDESWNRAFNKIPAFASLKRQELEKPYMGRLAYIQGIIRKRSKARYYNCIDYLEHIHLNGGMPLDEIETRAKKMRQLADFEGPLDEWLSSIGKPF